MNLFIDTSVIYTDPFWDRNLANAILDLANDEIIKIFISDLVIKELRKGYEYQLQENFNLINKAKDEIDKMSLTKLNYEQPDINKYLNDYDAFYQEIFTRQNIIIIPTQQETFNKVLERAIDYKKPFTENRSEFKDGVIWITYYEYAKANKLGNCILLTNNKKDFYDNKGNLHPDLKRDYDKFEAFMNFEELYKAKKDELKNPIKELKEFISSVNIDKDYVYELIIKYEYDNIVNDITLKIESYEAAQLTNSIDSIALWGGYASVDEVYLANCKDIDVGYINPNAIITGILLTTIGLNLYSYNSMRDDGEEKFPFYGSIDKEVEIYFNFLFDENEIPMNFEITDFVIK